MTIAFLQVFLIFLLDSRIIISYYIVYFEKNPLSVGKLPNVILLVYLTKYSSISTFELH